MDHHRSAVPNLMAAAAAPAANAGCAISEHWIGRTVVISASGVLDMLTAPRLQAGIAASVSRNPSAVIVDLSGVEFLASAGMAVLVSARERAEGSFEFRVVADGPATSRPLTMVGLADTIGLHPTLDGARATLGA